MNDKKLGVYAVVVCLLFVILPMVYYDMGYYVGVEETHKDPTPLTITMGVILLNSSTYNMSWYDIGFGITEGQPTPTLRNDSFLMYVNAHWGASDTFASHDDKTPHANITVMILPFGYGIYNFTIERVVIYGRSMLGGGQYVDNFYDNDEIKLDSIDTVGIAFFGYGSCQNNIDFWPSRNIVFTVGPVWYEEKEEPIPVDIP